MPGGVKKSPDVIGRHESLHAGHYESTIERWADHITNTRFDSIDKRYVQHAKNRIIDIIGCIIGGTRSPDADMVLSLAEDWGVGKNRSSAVGFRKTCAVPPHTAAMANAILARSFDFGVLIPQVGTRLYEAHLSETSVPTTLALSEALHLSGKEMISALIVGDDIASRLIAASNYSAGFNWDSTGTVNRFGATAIAGSLLRLSQKKMMNAFGIILDQLSGSFQSINDRVNSFKLAQGMAARDGIMAAELADVGWLGSKDPLFGKFGYFSLFCSGEPDTNILTEDLGTTYYADSIFKPYPCCRQMHIFIDCALNMVRENKSLDPKNIDKITVSTSSRVASGPLNVDFFVGEFPTANAMFNIAYNVANVLLRKKVDLDNYTEKSITDPVLNNLISRVSVIEGSIRDEESIDLAEITVRTKKGETFVAVARYAKGHPVFKPLSQHEIEIKFMRNVDFSNLISTRRAEALLNRLKRLDEIEDVREVTGLFSKIR